MANIAFALTEAPANVHLLVISLDWHGEHQKVRNKVAMKLWWEQQNSQIILASPSIALSQLKRK
jgi:hypothetical protein